MAKSLQDNINNKINAVIEVSRPHVAENAPKLLLDAALVSTHRKLYMRNSENQSQWITLGYMAAI